jgi:hypothetical protein
MHNSTPFAAKAFPGDRSSPPTTPAAPSAAFPRWPKKPRRDSPTLAASFSAALLIISNTIYLPLEME